MKAYVICVLVLTVSAASILLSPIGTAFAAGGQAMDLVRSIKAFYFKDASDFAVDFKVNSKMKDISFDGSFMFKPPMSFAVEAKSPALQLKIAFREGNGFIYLPAANMITNLDKLTQAKTRSVQIPKSMTELDTHIEKLPTEFDLTVTADALTKISGKSKKARGSFDAFVDPKTSELKSIMTFNNKGDEEISIEVKNFRRIKIDNTVFDKPQGAVETNLPIPIF